MLDTYYVEHLFYVMEKNFWTYDEILFWFIVVNCTFYAEKVRIQLITYVIYLYHGLTHNKI